MTNTLAPALHAAILLYVWAVIALRAALLPRSATAGRMTAALLFAGAALLLKDPVAGAWLAETWGPVRLRVAVHVLVMLAAAALVGLHRAWRYGDAEPPRAQARLYAAVAAAAPALWALSAPAHAAGVSVEQAGGWRAVAYFTVFCSPTMAGLAAVALYCARHWRGLPSRRERWTVAGAVTVFAVMLADSATMLAAAALSALRAGDPLVQAKEAGNSWLFAVVMTVAATVCAVLLAGHVTRPRTRQAESERPRDEDLARLWAAAAAAVPEVVLARRVGLSGSQLRLRQVTEIFDALTVLNHHTEPGDFSRARVLARQAGAEPGEELAVARAAVLALAAGRRASGHPPRPDTYPGAGPGGGTVLLPVFPDRAEEAAQLYARIGARWAAGAELALQLLAREAQGAPTAQGGQDRGGSSGCSAVAAQPDRPGA